MAKDGGDCKLDQLTLGWYFVLERIVLYVGGSWHIGLEREYGE